MRSNRSGKKNKYSDVKKRIDTGKTMRDVEILSDRKVASIRGEVFKRISSKKVNALISDNITNESTYLPSQLKEEHDVGESNMLSFDGNSLRIANKPTSKFILLDLRSSEEYGRYHIREC